MKWESDLKGMGYLTSTVSVALLGAVSWKSASQSRLLATALILGMVLSVAGMMLRWRSHRLDQKRQDERNARKAQEVRPSGDYRSEGAAGRRHTPITHPKIAGAPRSKAADS